MNIKSVQTFTCEIYVGGEIQDIERTCSDFCRSGFCVSVERVNFIYTGGRESGAVVRLVNYPRFPSDSGEILSRARELADKIIHECFQTSALIVAGSLSEWRTTRDTE